MRGVVVMGKGGCRVHARFVLFCVLRIIPPLCCQSKQADHLSHKLNSYYVFCFIVYSVFKVFYFYVESIGYDIDCIIFTNSVLTDSRHSCLSPIYVTKIIAFFFKLKGVY